MTISATTHGYRIDISPDERDQLVVALELAIAIRRNEPERFILVGDVDAPALDHLADVLVLAPVRCNA